MPLSLIRPMRSIGPMRRLTRRSSCNLRNALLAASALLGAGAREAPAQTPSVLFQQISIDQGLAQSIVTTVLQDRTGYLWLCTEDGLNRYDGYRFSVLRNRPDDANSLSHNQLTSGLEDRSGRIWLGTFNGGLNRFDPIAERWTRFRHDPLDSLSLRSDVVNALCEESAGALWIGTAAGLDRLVRYRDTVSGTEKTVFRWIPLGNPPADSGGLNVRALYRDRRSVLWVGTDEGLFKVVPVDSSSDAPDARYAVIPFEYGRMPGRAGDRSVRTLFEDRAGTLWVGTDHGLHRILPQAREPFSRPYTVVRYLHRSSDPASLTNDQVYAVYEDAAGTFWVGTNGGGVNVMNRGSGRFLAYRHDPRDARSLSYDEIRCIGEDRAGNVWIGTYGGGVSKVDKCRKRFALYRPEPGNPNSLNQQIVWSICQDRQGVLWLGANGGGLNRLDRRTGRWSHYLHDPSDPASLSHNTVRLVVEGKDGILWLGTNGGGINRFDPRTNGFTTYRHDPGDPTSLSHDEIRSMFFDRAGRLWIGTQGGGLNRLVPGRTPNDRPTFVRYRHRAGDPGSLSSDFIRGMLEDETGAFWIATYGGGLNRFDPATGTFRAYRANPDDPNGLSNDYLFTVHRDRDGRLWMGSWGGGLNVFDPETEMFSHFTMRDGLPSDAIYTIMEDRRGNFWLSTNAGLSRFAPKERRFRNYTVRDGLQSNEFNGGSAFLGDRGEMFFGGIDGFNAFFPEEIVDNDHVPPVVITSFRKLNQEVRFELPFSELSQLDLSHLDYIFSFEFAALDFTAPEKNRYAYRMEGLDKGWIHTDASNRVATYTTLPPGWYVFHVRGSNNDDVWNDAGVSIVVVVHPPYWRTWWFLSLSGLALLAVAFVAFRRRVATVRLRTELETAHRAQMSIMPAAAPPVQGFDIAGRCIPASEVGGDFYDYVRLGSREGLGIVVGDVSGKGMKAAMTAVLASGLVNADARSSDSVADVLTHLNAPLFEKTDREVFVAMCLAFIQPSTREFVFANAGLIKPLLVSGGRVTSLDAAGPTHPLGAVRDVRFAERRVALSSGDAVVLVTDGIPEAKNSSGEFYEIERLTAFFQHVDRRTMTAPDLCTALLNDVAGFVGGARQHDDMTVVVIRVP